MTIRRKVITLEPHQCKIFPQATFNSSRAIVPRMDLVAVLLPFFFFCWRPERSWPLREAAWP
jgi:hypothetical protein